MIQIYRRIEYCRSIAIWGGRTCAAYFFPQLDRLSRTGLCKGHPAQGYNLWMATVSEFKKMLPRLEEKGYPRYRYLIEQGFSIYCPVSNERRITVNSDNIVMPRIDIDGYSMNRRTAELEKYYFNVSEVLDSRRPVLSIK